MVKHELRIAELELLLAEKTAKLIQQSEELSVISSVQEALVQEMDMQSIYDLIGEKIRNLFDAQGVIISTFDHEKELEEFQYAIENEERFYPESRPINKLRRHLIDSGQKIVINTVEEAIEWFGKEVVPGTKYMQSGVFVPLISNGKVSSYISLQNVEREHAFSTSEIRLLETLANSMAAALQSARLLKETEQRTAELAVINSVQEGLAQELDIQAIYDLVGNRIRDLFDAQVVGIATFDHGREYEHINYLIEKGERFYPDARPMNTLRKHLIQNKEKIVINKNFEAVATAFGVKNVPGTEPPKSAVYVPMLTAEKVTGYVSLQNIDKENAFSDSDVRLLETLANTMGVALENARLFDETTRLLKEKDQRNAELAVINSVQESLVAKMDIQGIYELVGEKIREIFDAQVIDIVIYNKATQNIEDRYAYEKGDRTMLGPRKVSGFRKHIIQTKQLVAINENVAEKLVEFGNEILIGEIPKSIVYVPMIAGGEVKGIISLQNVDHEHAFSDSDINLITTLANSMSVALESARLFDETARLLKETEQRNAELAVINSVQESLVAKMDMQGIYELVGEKIREIFDAQVIDIVIYDKVNQNIEDRYAYEKGDRTMLGPRAVSGFRQHVIRSKQLVLHNEKVEDAMREFGNEILIGEIPKSQVFVPMIAGGEVKGIISLQNLDHEHAFSESDVNLITTLANSMSVALESARLFDETARLLKETEQRNAELAVINSVQESLVAKMDMQGIYELVGEKIREIFEAQVIDIVIYDKATQNIEDRYAYEKGDRTMLGSRPVSGIREHVIQTKQLYVRNENVEEAMREFGIEVLIGEQSKSFVFVPMIAGGDVKGIISLQNVDHEHAFSESDINLITTLANSMSVALESARLFDETARLLKETEQRNAELAVINSVQESLVAKMDMHGIYELVGEKIREIFDAQVIDIVTYDPRAEQIADKYSYEKGDRTMLGPRPVSGIRKHVIYTKQVFVCNENSEKAMKDHGVEVLIGEHSKSFVFVPMIAGGEVKGIISLQNVDHEHAFSESDVNLITTLANSMSVALESARLFDETARLLKETEQRTAELAVINSVQDGLAKELDIQGIYDLVGEKMREIFNAQVFDISTYDKTTNLIEDKYTYEMGDTTLLPPRPLTGFRKWVIENNKPLMINQDIEKYSAQLGNVVMAGEVTRSVVFVPMTVGGEIAGVMSLQSNNDHAFTDADVRLLTTLGNSMTVALENARLFDETNRLLKETEQRTAELAVINSVQDGLAKELDVQGIYDLVGDRLCALFPETQTLVIRTFDHNVGLEHFHYAIEKGHRLSIEARPFIWASKKMIHDHKPIFIAENYIETANKYGGSGVTKGKPPKSAVFVPMMVGEVVKGSVSLQNVDIEHAFSDSDVSLLTTITNSMTVALENARLFDETILLLSESKQRGAELSTVNNISKALATQLDPADLLTMVGDQLKDLFNANIVYIAILNKKTNIINFPYQYGDNMAPLVLGEGLTSKIIQTGEPILIIKDLGKLRKKMGIQLIGVEAASYLGVPIPLGGENIGVLSVQSTEQENRFDENDQRLLTTIASSVGVALNNATLFEDVRQAKKEAEAATNAAEMANDAKSAFLSTVSHELRTPLTSVLGFAKIIRKRLDERIFPIVNVTDAKIEKTMHQITENLQVVISEGERLTHLINDVLDLAKIEAGKMEWNQENISMSEITERAIAATTSLFDQKPLQLVKNISNNLPEVIGDKDKLIQVVINLISNAVKFTDEGNITCSVFVDKKELIVSISDTGIGIASEDYGAVFEQFKQVGGDTLTDKPKGTGLGLPICKEIVEHHGGRLWLESVQGEGSTFSFALPIPNKEGDENPLQFEYLINQLKEQIGHTQLKNIGKGANILIVDDDESIRSLLHQELGEAGYVVQEAGNGKEALELVRSNRPDLIILDIMMPEMNGFDVAAVLKNDPETMDIPIIVLSVVQDKARGFMIGVDRYLTKPIDTRMLFDEIGSLLEQGRSKKKVLIVDKDGETKKTLSDVLLSKGYEVSDSDEKEIVEKAVHHQPDIIMIHATLSEKQNITQTLRQAKGLDKVLIIVYQ